MFVAFILAGTVMGWVAAALALASGAGLLTALGACALAGTVAALSLAAWSCLCPRRPRQRAPN